MSKLPNDRHVRALVELYREAELRLTQMVSEAVASGALGTEAYRLRQVSTIQAFLAAVQVQALPTAGEIIAQGYREGLVIADGTLVGNFNSIHQDALDVLVENLVSRLTDANATVGRRVEDVFRREALRESALGLIESGTRRQATERLKENLVREGKTAFVDRAGRRWDLSTYTSMALRTTSREAVVQATLNRFSEEGRDLVSISEHANACELCRPFQGKTYSLSGTDKQFPKLPREAIPPIHPNCRHTLLPAKVDFERFEKAVKRAKSLEDLEAALA